MNPAETVSSPIESPGVDLQVSCPATGLPTERELSEWLARAAEEANARLGQDAELSVRIVDEPESRELNRRYRGKDRSTNVLAFPAGLESLPGLPAKECGLLGDLVICAPVIEREARAQGKAVPDHWAHMLVHGFLHLLGYDHRTSDEAETMESLEVRILAAGGLENPYEDRQPD